MHHPDAGYARAVTESLWQLGNMPEAALEQLSLSGDGPLLPTSFHVGTAAQSTIACAALSAASIAGSRGAAPQQVSVDMHDAERECTGQFTLDGETPKAWAPLSGLYPCMDGFVRIHANFDHHRDGVVKLLGIDGNPERVTRAQVTRALAHWTRANFETEAARKDLVVAAARSFDEWDQHPQSVFISGLPLFTIDKIGEAEPVRLPDLAPGARPLSDVRILDLTRILAGPVCGRTLAAYGGDVMLINSPDLPNIAAIADTSRGKRSALVDLTNPEGCAILRSLIAGSHIFIQGYRPGGLARFGFGPEEVAAIRPGAIYVSLSAYSHSGPWARRRGFDSLVQTAGGFNLAERDAAGSDLPRPLPVQILDFASGFLMAFAAQAALHRQLAEGGSWHVRVSLAQTAHWLRRLGRVENNFDAPAPSLNACLQPFACGFGQLRALPHAARFSGTPATWTRASNPPGTDQPAW